MVTIIDDSKQQDVKRFVKNFVLDAPIESNPSWKPTSETEQLYFWIGGHPYLFSKLSFTTQSVILGILLAFSIYNSVLSYSQNNLRKKILLQSSSALSKLFLKGLIYFEILKVS